MNQYVTGAAIKHLREAKNMTQAALAEKLLVSDKAVSKWETGKGYPDITLLQPLSAALGVSVAELLSGQCVVNANRSANIARSKWYVCPVCGNVLWGTGAAAISCCGIALPPLEPEAPDDAHTPSVAVVEDEYDVTLPNHPMSKEHHLSFFAAVGDNGVQIVKLYPEGPAEAWFKISRVRRLYFYCNRHGLFACKLK